MFEGKLFFSEGAGNKKSFFPTAFLTKEYVTTNCCDQ